MANPKIVKIEPIENERTRYTLGGPHTVVVIMDAENEVVAASQDAGEKAAKRAIAAVFDYIHKNR